MNLGELAFSKIGNIRWYRLKVILQQSMKRVDALVSSTPEKRQNLAAGIIENVCPLMIFDCYCTNAWSFCVT